MARPSYQTGRLLLARSGNQCAFRNCVAPISDLAANIITGEIAHIKADSPGGPRYDPDQSEAERQGFDNLLIMCPPCHKIIDDDPATYTVDVLRRIKAEHEGKQHQTTIVVLNPSALDRLRLGDESDHSRLDRQVHERRVEVIGELYRRLVTAERAFNAAMFPLREGPSPEAIRVQEVEDGKAAALAGNAFIELFQVNRIWLDAPLRARIERLTGTFHDAWAQFTMPDEQRGSARERSAAWRRITDEVPRIRAEIERDMRILLGIEKPATS